MDWLNNIYTFRATISLLTFWNIAYYLPRIFKHFSKSIEICKFDFSFDWHKVNKNCYFVKYLVFRTREILRNCPARTLQLGNFFGFFINSSLKVVYTLENCILNFVMFFCFKTHDSEWKWAVFWKVVKKILYPFLKPVNFSV